MNRQARRTAKRLKERKQQATEAGAAVLMQAIAVNRQHAITLLLTALFDVDLGGQTAHLKGLGGATGVAKVEDLQKLAQEIASIVLLPGNPPGEEEDESGIGSDEGTDGEADHVRGGSGLIIP